LEGPQKDVDNPTASQGGQTVDHEELTPEEKQVIELLRTHKLSIKHLDEERRQMIRQFIQHLHHEKGISLSDIAKLIGNKTSGYTSWLTRQLGIQPRDFEEARLAGIHKKVRKYERKPFDGTDEDKAYLLGLRHGDLSVSIPFGDAIRVSTSTTHPAMAKLFTELFSPYGHVYQHPRYKKDTKTYEWNLQTILDGSFDFLLQSFEQTSSRIQESETSIIAYLSGLLDADGSIVLTKQFGKVYLFLVYNNSNKRMLEWIQGHVKRWGYFCNLQINKKAGGRTKKYGIIHRSDYWQFSAYGMDRIQELIAKLQPRHSEKIRRQSLALSVHKGQDYASIQHAVELFRAQIDQEVQNFVQQAQQEYEKKHIPQTSPPPSFSSTRSL